MIYVFSVGQTQFWLTDTNYQLPIVLKPYNDLPLLKSTEIVDSILSDNKNSVYIKCKYSLKLSILYIFIDWIKFNDSLSQLLNIYNIELFLFIILELENNTNYKINKNTDILIIEVMFYKIMTAFVTSKLLKYQIG